MKKENIKWLYQGDRRAFSHSGLIMRYNKEEDSGFQIVFIKNIYNIIGDDVYKMVHEYKDNHGLYGQPEKVEIIPGSFSEPGKKIISNPLVCNEFNKYKFCKISHRSVFTKDVINEENISYLNDIYDKKYQKDNLSDDEIMEIGIFCAEQGLFMKVYPDLIAQKTKALEIITSIFYMDGMPKHIKDNLIY